MTFVGRYINLERSADRRASMEAQLHSLGVADRYSRFAAVDGRSVERPASTITPTELGCFLSHHQLLVEAANRSEPTHIVEDDVVFSGEAAKLLDAATQTGALTFDVLFTDIFVSADFHTLYRLYAGLRASGAAEGRGRRPIAVQCISLTGCAFASCGSYVVTPAGAAKLAAALAAELARGPTVPVDLVHSRLIASGEVTGLCMVPFITSVDTDQFANGTIVREHEDRPTAFASFLQRYYFFFDRDEAKMRAWAEVLSANEPADALDLVWPGILFLIRHGRSKRRAKRQATAPLARL